MNAAEILRAGIVVSSFAGQRLNPALAFGNSRKRWSPRNKHVGPILNRMKPMPQPEYPTLQELRDEIFGGVLNLSGKGIRALPETLGQLFQVRKLDLSNNSLTALPDSIGRLRVEQLSLSNNKLAILLLESESC